MPTPTDNLTVLLCQTDCNDDPDANIARIRDHVIGAGLDGVDVAVVPENALYRGNFQAAGYEPPTLDQHLDTLSGLTTEFGVTTVWGSVQVRRDDGIYNTTLVIAAGGSLVTKYEKIHLFQLFTDTSTVDETSRFAHGSQPATFEINGWTIGLTICYDLRFPELYRAYAGAELMLCPAEFTHMTGKAHWEVLLRARAIENQCFIAGINQCGMNESMNVRAYGHSMMVGPWGDVLSAADEDETCLRCELSRTDVTNAREQIPSVHSIRHKTSWSNSR
jgi:predicted amidohydrolase